MFLHKCFFCCSWLFLTGIRGLGNSLVARWLPVQNMDTAAYPPPEQQAKAKAISHLAEQWACGVAERTRPQRVPLFDRFLFWSVSKFFQGQRHLWSKLLHRLFSKSVFNILQPFVSQAQFLGPESSPRFARR